MWGDLEEQKGRKSTSLEQTGGHSRHITKEVLSKSKAFHCCLKEYGVKKRIQRSVELEESGSEGNQAADSYDGVWERRWRMFGTTIV